MMMNAWCEAPIRSLLILVLCACAGLNAAPTTAAPPAAEAAVRDTEQDDAIVEESLNYFFKFDYLVAQDIPPGKTPGETLDSKVFKRAVKNLQRYYNINKTGIVDEATRSVMALDRCGNTDPFLDDDEDNADGSTSSSSSRVRRYNVAGGFYKWNKNTLTYRISSFPSMRSSTSISEYQVRLDTRRAFRIWSDVTPLVFVEVYETDVEVDIELEFGSRVHTSVNGDPPFDGPGGTLAHAFTPNSGWGKTNGDVHFDDDENFTHKKYTGVNFFYTAAHEIGHALGLDHSDQRNSLMWPWDKGYIADFRLPTDDRLGIQEIYGTNPFEVSTLPPPTTPPPTEAPVIIPPYCDSAIDAVANIRETLFVFKDERLWRFRKRVTEPGGTESVFPLVAVDQHDGVATSQFFYGLRKGMNAVYERMDGRIVFLKGRKKWVFDGTRLLEGPIRTDEGAQGYPSTVYGALYDKRDGITYLFKGRKVWKYDELTRETTKTSLKRLFVGLHPSARINGGFTFGNDKFLMDGPFYYRVDSNNYVPNAGKLNFGQDILGCPPMS